MPFKRF